MQVTSKVLDSADGFVEVAATNPVRADRGAVRLATRGGVWWGFLQSDPSAAVGDGRRAA
jgi:hypothetical protein